LEDSSTKREDNQPSRHPLPDWKLRAVDGITVNFGRLINAAMWVIIVRYGYYAVVALSGKHTLADIGLKLLANVSLSQSLAWTGTGGATIWAVSERTLRKRIIRQKAERIKHLEQHIDSNRSSSALMADGSTRPEDNG
jgi:hypothetical protein